ncbi:hypothetical protein HZC31_04180 [Candidatus Woesearchaeota archaeon]|nr:hypothetical protein [Candidatus Woesearchaeota archaeon]
MEEREVYIVQSNHPNQNIEKVYQFFSRLKKDRSEAEEMIKRGKRIQEKAKDMFRCAHQISKDIILREKITEMYSDGMTRGRAASLNYRTPQIQRKCEALYQEGVEGKDLEELAFTESDLEEGSATIIAILAECNFREIETKMQATETELLDPKITRLLYQPIVVIEAWLQMVTGVYPITARMRDRYIYQNMKRNAAQKSILFMGTGHELADFYKPNSGFAVAMGRITKRGSQYRFANRDGVPDFFREIVERRYAEMKERTVCP